MFIISLLIIMFWTLVTVCSNSILSSLGQSEKPLSEKKLKNTMEALYTA